MIEMAEAAGLPLLVENQKNPEQTTTLGVGELILKASQKGAKKIILGLGGSATNDCGIGMAHALGYRFLDAGGHDLAPVGGNLIRISSIVPPSSGTMLDGITIQAACDVNNPLFGPQGAACIFAPQKGADPEMVRRLDNGLAHFASVMQAFSGSDVSQVPDSGAAGGLGAGVLTFLNGTLMPGIELLLGVLEFDQLVQSVDLVITGEGRMDEYYGVS